MKKVQEEYKEDLKNLDFKLQKLENQIRLKLRYKNQSASSLHNEHYQIQPDREEYFQDWSDELYELQSKYKILWGNHNELMTEATQIDK